MKRLMILGGARYALPVIEAAHKLGAYVITCDYLPDNIAHKFSDEYANVSIIDKEAVLAKAKELRIDGIMSFACDPGVVTAAYVAEKMGLPSAGSYESISILQNKGRFRKFLTDNGFNVPVSKAYKNVDQALEEVNIFNWPVIVKPTDSAGSKGVKKVEKKEDLRAAIEYAIKYSLSDEFIIEDFLEQKGFSSDCDSFAIDGKVVVFGFDCQWFDKKAENPYTPAAYSWPSSISNENLEYLKSEIQRVIKLLDLKTSVFNIEVRECINGKPYIMELTPRGGGNRLSEMMRIGTGVDMITNAVKYALGLPVDKIEPSSLRLNLAEIILHSDKPGIYDDLWINPVIEKNVIERDLWISKGAKVGGFKGANEAIGTLVLGFDSKDELDSVMNNQEHYVKVMVI